MFDYEGHVKKFHRYMNPCHPRTQFILNKNVMIKRFLDMSVNRMDSKLATSLYGSKTLVVFT